METVEQLAEARNVLWIVELKISCALEALDLGKIELIRSELVEIEQRINLFLNLFREERETTRSNRWAHEAAVRSAEYDLNDVLTKIGTTVLNGDLKDKKLIKKLFNLQSKAIKLNAKLKKLQG